MTKEELLEIDFEEKKVPLKKYSRTNLNVNKETVRLFREILPLKSDNTGVLFLLQLYMKHQKQYE